MNKKEILRGSPGSGRVLNGIMSMIILMLGTALVFNSCKKNTVDVTDLLKTVPSSAAGVIVFNTESMLDGLGCKIKDNKVTLGAELQAVINEHSGNEQDAIMALFNGDSGVDPKALVLFYDSNRAYLTMWLYDEEKFYAFAEKEGEEKFVDMGGGLKVMGNTAVKGGQAWICISPRKRLDADAVTSYSKLNASQSFLVTPMGEELLVSEDDVRGWVLLDVFTSDLLSRQNRSMATMGSSFLFENAESIKFSVEFEKGKVELESIPLDSNYKPAKYKLPASKIDVAQLKTLGESCDGLMAFTVTPKLAKKLGEISKMFGGLFFGDAEAFLKNIDGTVGLIGSGNFDENMSLSALIDTKGPLSQDLKNFLSEYVGNLSEDGNLVRVKKGNVSGSLNVAEAAEALKGCCMGIVLDQSQLDSFGNIDTKGFSYIAFKLDPEGGGIEFKVEGVTQNKDEYSLLTILK